MRSLGKNGAKITVVALGERISKVLLWNKSALKKKSSMKSHQKVLKRKSVVLFFKSHLPPALRSMGDFYSQCLPFHRL